MRVAVGVASKAAAEAVEHPREQVAELVVAAGRGWQRPGNAFLRRRENYGQRDAGRHCAEDLDTILAIS